MNLACELGHSPSLVLIFQDELLRGLEPEADAGRAAKVLRFSAEGDWRSQLRNLEAQIAAAAPSRTVLFCSLQIAAFVGREGLTALRLGLLQNEDRLSAHIFSGHVPQTWLLNRDFVLLPFGQVAARGKQLRRLFGDRLFMRPSSGNKAFSGCVFDIEDIDHEVSAQRQINVVGDDELVLIDRARPIAAHEYRFWIMDGVILSHAAYAFTAEEDAPPCPEVVVTLAVRLAAHLRHLYPAVVADLVLDEGGVPRLIELNGFNTSGFYPGVDFGALASGIDRLLL